MKDTIKTKNTDELVLELFNKVKQKQKEVEVAERPQYKTCCSIGKNPDAVGDRVNLQTVTEIWRLVDLYAFLSSLEKGWREAAIDLDIKVDSYKYLGYSIENWKADIRTRIGQVEINKKRKELEQLESRLNNLITIEQRRTLEIEQIVKSDLLK